MIKIHFTENDLKEIEYLRYHHPDPKVQKRMEVIWLKSHQLDREKISAIASVHPDTVTNYTRLFVDKGIEGLKTFHYRGQKSCLNKHIEEIQNYFSTHIIQTIQEACYKIKELTGLERKATQVRQFMKKLGFRYIKSRQIPAKANLKDQKEFKEKTLEPLLEQAQKGEKAVYFMDAAHFVFSVVLGYLWTTIAVIIPSYSGRKRFNVLGAINAVTHQLYTFTNDTYINAASVCALLGKIKLAHPDTPIAIILDNARYQKCQLVQDVALSLGIELVFLPPYSPNLNLIERVWKFMRKECLCNRCYKEFSCFRSAILECCDQFHIKYQHKLSTLLTWNFQLFEKEENLAV